MTAILSIRIFLRAINSLRFRLLTVRKNLPPHTWGRGFWLRPLAALDPHGSIRRKEFSTEPL